MKDKLLEQILNFVLNNLGNKEFMHLNQYLESRQKFYLENQTLREIVEVLKKSNAFYAPEKNWNGSTFKGEFTGGNYGREIQKQVEILEKKLK